MKDWWKVATGLGGVVAMVVAALSYFPSRIEFTNITEAIAGQVKQNSDQLNYQSLLRQQEYLFRILEKRPNDNETKRRLKQIEKQIKAYEKRLFG